jgi:hypothetical protein
MNNIIENQKKAGKARVDLQKKEEDLYLDQNRLKAKQEQLLLAKRLGKAGENEIFKLTAEIKNLEKRITKDKHLYESAKGNLFNTLSAFPSLNQPQKLVEELDDRLPFLLFPVRLETRFMDVDNGRELWVRVFPDEIAVHTHEKTLTQDELEAGITYWQEIWAASREEDADKKARLEKEAWWKLADSYESNRAAWIASETKPETLDVDDVGDLIFPEFEEEALKKDPWSRAPRSKVMPDRFVFIAFSHGKAVFEKTGNLIPNPLVLGPDPQSLEPELAQEEGDLHLGSGNWHGGAHTPERTFCY